MPRKAIPWNFVYQSSHLPWEHVRGGTKTTRPDSFVFGDLLINHRHLLAGKETSDLDWETLLHPEYKIIYQKKKKTFLREDTNFYVLKLILPE